MTNRYIVVAGIAILLVTLSYVAKFYFSLGYGISDDSAVWASLGEYLGGVLSPVLSFISIVLLIKSLTLQNEANASLRENLRNSEKTEKIRSFEALFFNMIESQKELFKHLSIDAGGGLKPHGVEAVLWVEEKVEELRKECEADQGLASVRAVRDLIESIDSRDQIFGISRIFYIIVKLINEKLSASHGFDEKERMDHFLALINFTDYSQLRLVLIIVQFMEYPSAEYIRNNEEFTRALNNVGMNYSLY